MAWRQGRVRLGSTDGRVSRRQSRSGRAFAAGDGDAAGEIDHVEIAVERFAVIIAHGGAGADRDGVAHLDLKLRGGRPIGVGAGVHLDVGVAGGGHGFEDFTGKAVLVPGGSWFILSAGQLGQTSERQEEKYTFHRVVIFISIFRLADIAVKTSV